MNIQSKLSGLCTALVACTAIGMTAMQSAADDGAGQPIATENSVAPENISDWALAGIVWSDASLTRKLALDALRQQNDEEKAAALQHLVSESTRIVRSLEQFGWRHAQPDPVEPKLAQSNLAQPNPAQPNPVSAHPVQPTPVQPNLAKANTAQATSGRSSPAAVEGAVATGPEVELEPFGVEDYVDETPREAGNPVDAREDGVEAAIAAAPSSGIPGPEAGAGRISQREVQTRSNTLPYSADSIYDADDYDPDVDYQVDNPLAARSVSPRTNDLLDDDHQVATDAAPLGGGERTVDPAAGVVRSAEYVNPLAARRPLRAHTRLDRFTTDAARHRQDAAWVQLRLDENQLRYASLAARQDLDSGVAQALQRLQTTTMIAGRSTNNASLKSVLVPILQLKIEE